MVMDWRVRGVLGNLNHEGMHLSPEEMKLLEAYVAGEISEEEYDRRALRSGEFGVDCLRRT